MSFHAWARGITADRSRPFIYRRREFTDEEDIYEMADLMEKLTRGRASGHEQVYNMYGTLGIASCLKRELDDLAMHGHDARVWIDTSTGRQYRTSEFVLSDYLTDSVERVMQFARLCTRVGVNRWGMLRGISMILSGYYAATAAAGYGEPTLIRIEIDL